jgi:glycosyltransferase involved in cell wall biosynthesis
LTVVADRPIRILHVLGAMNFGGVETWLLRVLRHIDRERFRMDFLVDSTGAAVDHAEIRALGSAVIRGAEAGGASRPWWYARHFSRILREHGPYAVVHSHVHHANGYVLRLARHAAVPVCIAHSHLETSPLLARAGLLRRGYIALMTRWIRRHATLGLAASRKAAADLFGPAWPNDPRWRVHVCGVALEPFADQVDRRAVRAELGVPPDAFVVGHVGRFHPQKNHLFLIDVVEEAARHDPRIHLLLVGDGPLRPAIERRIEEVGLANRAVLTGPRRDVPRLMLGAMDALVFPSVFEGLGLVLVEAQAGGLPCVLASNIPEEADVVKPLMYRRSLSEPPASWAAAIAAIKRAGAGMAQPEARKAVEQSAFNIRTEVRELEALYHACVQGAA